MDTIARTIFAKFASHPEVGKKTRLLLRLALTDFDEIYQDEILAAADELQILRTNLAAALDRLTSADRRIDELLAETDAREAECTRLKHHTTGAASTPPASSSAITASMGSLEHAAPNTSSTAAPTPASPAASLHGAKRSGRRASAASGSISTGDDSIGLDPTLIRWGEMQPPAHLLATWQRLDSGDQLWRTVPAEMQREMIRFIGREIVTRLPPGHFITQKTMDSQAPLWLPVSAAWIPVSKYRWGQLLSDIQAPTSNYAKRSLRGTHTTGASYPSEPESSE